MEAGKVLIVWAMVLLFITVSMSMPRRRFIVHCDNEIACNKVGPPVCATDGKFYINKCFIEIENQKRYCRLGVFNPVAFVHEGKC